MKTYKIVAQTNGYIASRDMTFNGKTSVDLIESLTYEEAREKIQQFATSDYESTNSVERVENNEEYLRFYCAGIISDMAYQTGLTEEEYFSTHKKMLQIFYNKKANKMFEKFEGSGLYVHGDMHCCAIITDDCDSYEHDSRYYSIVEEKNENE